jgi:hypothetical protein
MTAPPLCRCLGFTLPTGCRWLWFEQALGRSWARSRSRGFNEPWVRTEAAADGVVEHRVQCTQADYDAVPEHADLAQLRIAYDPLDDTNPVLPAATVADQPLSRFSVGVLGVSAGVTVIMMGMVMIIDSFHCGKHFWGRMSCCDDCDDWVTNEIYDYQTCYRGACDGLGGRTHLYWCEEPCDVMWALLPLPTTCAPSPLVGVQPNSPHVLVCALLWGSYRAYLALQRGRHPDRSGHAATQEQWRDQPEVPPPPPPLRGHLAHHEPSSLSSAQHPPDVRLAEPAPAAPTCYLRTRVGRFCVFLCGKVRPRRTHTQRNGGGKLSKLPQICAHRWVKGASACSPWFLTWLQQGKFCCPDEPPPLYHDEARRAWTTSASHAIAQPNCCARFALAGRGRRARAQPAATALD